LTDPISRLNAALEGRYRIDREVGEGGMAKVFLASDLKHDRRVALKVLEPALTAIVGTERFLAEIKTTANLHHPHILPLFDSGEADSLLFYVMPYVEGESLREKIDREGPLPVDEAVRIATNVAEALDYAHRRGIVHRDVKPANILLQDGKPVVSDFGVALAVGVAGADRLTETGLSLGTPYYMSPEQATGEERVGPATDIYALACVLYEMLTGDPPFMASTAQGVLGKIIQSPPVTVTESRPSVPAHVEAAIRKGLEKLPADRFGSANELAAALTSQSSRPDTTTPTAPSEATGAKRWVAGAVAILSVAALSLLWVSVRPDESTTPSEEPSAASAPTRDRLPNSIAVLPFQNLSADPEDAFFATGMHDELLSQLAKIRDLNVIARTSVLQYADGLTPIPDVARELNVETVMEGTVRYADGNVRVTTQLIDGVTDTHLWSESYTRPFQNIFEIESDIAQQIAAALEAELLEEERINLGAQPTTSREAFAAYVRAVELWQSSPPTPDALAAVDAGMDRVITLDPGFAAPYAIKSNLASERLFADVGTPDDWQTERVRISQRAIELAETAIRLDPTYGYPYAALAKIHFQNWRDAEALAAIERAAELSPTDPETLIEYSWLVLVLDRREEAVAAADRVGQLDPSNADLHHRMCVTYAMAGNHERARALCREAMALDPAFPSPPMILAGLETERGNDAEAVRLVGLAENLAGPVESGFIRGNFAYAYGLAGRPDEAARVFEQMEGLAERRRVGAYSWAVAHLGVGDTDGALEWLEAMIDDPAPDEGSIFRLYIGRNIFGDPVLERPEFADVRRRLGFEN
jgi:serine/threonine protein kinase/Flp pilus assembly protein TadD